MSEVGTPPPNNSDELHGLVSSINKNNKNIYIRRLTSLERSEPGVFCHLNSHVCGQENWFQNWSTEDFAVNNHWKPTLSIAQTNLHEVRNILV